MLFRPRALALAAAVVMLSGCTGAGAGDGAGDRAASSGRTGNRQLTAFAAASLTGVFDDLARAFTEQNPGTTVKAVYDGSSTFATQLIEGASADVFATADEATMARVVAGGLLKGTPELFATNTLEIAVAPGNPSGILGLSDLADPDLTVVTCAVQVPCGAASAEILGRAGVNVTTASEEQNVKAVVTKVALGEADAGLVYATDVLAAHGEVDGVPIVDAANTANRYLIATLAEADDPEGADAFVRFVLSPAGQAVLADAGFGSR